MTGLSDKKQKILYLITQSEWGGAQRYVYDLAVNLNEEYDVAVAFGGKKELFERLRDKKIKTISLSYLERKVSPINDLKSLIELVKTIKKEKPDIIHLNSSKAGILGSLAAKLGGVKRVVYTAHGWVFNEPLPWWLKSFYFWLEKISSLWKDKIICVSLYDYQAAIQKNLCSRKKLVIINNGIAFLDFLSREEARERLNSKFQIQNNHKVIGTIANLYKTKGIEYLIEAAKIINNPNFVFVIIGEGKKFKNLKLQIANLKLENQVKLLGSIPDFYRYLKAVDLFVLPSVKEGFPYTILEAMAAQIPTIATKVGGIPEMIENNKTGVLVESKNPRQLAEKINWVLNNFETAQTYAVKAREKLEREFTLEKMIKKTKEIYQD